MPDPVTPCGKPKVEPAHSFPFIDLYRASPIDRVGAIKAGVPARQFKQLIRELDVDQKLLFGALNLKTATVNKKAAKNHALSTKDGERVVGLVTIVGQLEAMIEESGDPTVFNATEWLSVWLLEPLPSLGGIKPIDLLDTMEGQAIVSHSLAQIQSGVFA